MLALTSTLYGQFLKEDSQILHKKLPSPLLKESKIGPQHATVAIVVAIIHLPPAALRSSLRSTTSLTLVDPHKYCSV